MEPSPAAHHDLRVASREALVFWAIGALVVLTVLMFHAAIDVVLLTLAGLLFGTTLRGAAEWLAAGLHVRVGWGVTICLGILAGILALSLFWIVPHIDQQAGLLWQQLVAAFEDLRARLSENVIGARLVQEATRVWTWLEQHVAFAAGVLTGFVGAIGAVVYVGFVALYYAYSPWTYRRGVLALVPPGRRDRANAILDALGSTLRRWLWARLVSMTVLGIASAIGLWVLGIPLAATLGLIAGVLLFVPYLGSIVSAIPALLIAATVTPLHVVYVALLYIVIHMADGYLLDPSLQKRAVRIPPVLVLGSQLLLGTLWGVIGFTFATPLVAAVVIAVRMIYVEDILHAEAPPAERPDARDVDTVPA